MNWKLKYLFIVVAATIAGMALSMNSQASGSIHHNNVLIGGGASSSAVSRATNIQGQKQQTNVTGMGSNFVSTTKHQAPSFGFGAMFPTAPCQATLGAGFSFLLGGGAAAGSRTLEQCELRETIRTTIHMNQYGIDTGDAAIELLCMTEHGAKTTLCKARAPEEATVTEPQPEEKQVSLDWPWNW
jgi:hypothetical protein